MKQSIIMIACIMLFPGLFSANAQVLPDHTLEVTIMMFSGMKNPTYEINDSETIQMLQKAFAQKTFKRQQKADQNSGLGYNGLEIRNKNNIPGIPEYFKIVEGMIIVLDAGSAGNATIRGTASGVSDNSVAPDTDREIEKTLLIGDMKKLIDES